MELTDPERKYIRPLLLEKGLSETNITTVFESLGTRLRLLAPILDDESVPMKIEMMVSRCHGAVAALFTQLDAPEDMTALIQAMDTIAVDGSVLKIPSRI